MEKNTRRAVIKIGAGLAAAGAAASYYFYGSPKAKNHRKVATKWATAMKQEVVKEARRLEKASPKVVAAIVDRVAKTYQGARSIDNAEVRRAAKELKANWAIVQREAKQTVRKSITRAKRTVTRAA